MSDSIEKEDIPQVPVSTIVAEPTFTPEVVAALLRNEGGTVEGIPLLARQYVRTYRNIPGAPEIQDLKTTETRAIVGTLSFEPSADIDWAGYTARVQANEDFEQNANNPYFPRWFSKTDKNDACPWVSDTGDINEINQTAINQLFYDWQRPFAPGNKFIDVLKLAPIANSMVMDTIVEALTNFAPMLLRPMGNDTGKNTEFRWSTTLPFLGSLGFDAFRKFSAFVAQHSDEEDFQEWSKVPDAKFAAEL
jgi:hypothetical protein